MRNSLSTLLRCCIAICILFVFSPAFAFDFGSGTPEDPYIISTPEQLFDMADDPFASYALGCNIMLSEKWTPVGSMDEPFMGSFDGRGYEISGLDVELYSDDILCAGLFGYVLDGSIANLTVSGSVSVLGGEFSELFAGGIVGYMMGGSITDCRNMCSVSANSECVSYVGGIAGMFEGSELSRCCNNGEIYAKGLMVLSGGITACTYEIAVTDCYNTAPVTAISFSIDPDFAQSDAGGILASGSAVRCYNTGKVSAQSDIQPIAGSISGSCDYIV